MMPCAVQKNRQHKVKHTNHCTNHYEALVADSARSLRSGPKINYFTLYNILDIPKP